MLRNSYGKTLSTPDIRLLIALLLVSLTLIAAPLAARAATTVGNGTPASCTEAALRSALAAGGLITFNCGPNPATITVAAEIEIRAATEIDGGGPRQGGRVTLSGGGTSRVLRIKAVAVTLRNLTIRDGKATGAGGIWADSFSTVAVFNSRFENNDGTPGNNEHSGGAIGMRSDTSLTVHDSLFINNRGINGGAINVLLSSLTVVDSTFLDNDSTPGGTPTASFDGRFGSGGAIYIDGASNPPDDGVGGTITIRSSVFRSNRAVGSAGAVFSFLYAPDRTIIEDSTFDGNRVFVNGFGSAIGGALRHGNGPLTISRSTFSNNTAATSGGAIWSGRNYPATITNTTFFGNRADRTDKKGGMGGALYIDDGSFSILNSTIAGNYAEFMGGGIFAGDGKVVLRNSIVANNTLADPSKPWGQCSSRLSSGSNNLQWGTNLTGPDADYTCSPQITLADPKLGSLADNGGPTWTMALLAGSPAIKAGSNCPATDQRGASRQAGCDIGAYAFGAQAPKGVDLVAPTLATVNTDAAPVVAVSWSAVEGATRYRLEVSRDSGFTGLVRVFASDEQSLRVVLEPGAYHLRVSACDSVGCGPPSAAASVTLGGDPAQVYLALLRR